MVIRKATLDDCRVLLELRMEMRRERETRPLTIPEDRFEEKTFRYFEDNIKNGSFVAFIAEENGSAVAISGMCFYLVPPTYGNPEGRVAYIMNMYTKPEFRRRKIASALLHELVLEAKRQGCATVTLNASDMGKSLYLRYGFRNKTGEMVYHTDAGSNPSI